MPVLKQAFILKNNPAGTIMEIVNMYFLKNECAEGPAPVLKQAFILKKTHIDNLREKED